MALDFAAGCVGGCAGLLASYPLDTVKVHMQMGAKGSAITCLKRVIAKESMSGLFRGVTSPLGGVAFANAVVFGVYGATLRQFPDQSSVSSQLASGALAGCAQSVILCPVELAKTRMQLGMNGGTVSCMRRIAQEGGIRALYQGFGSTVLRETPAIAVYFAAFELLSRTKDGSPPSMALTFTAGGLAGAASWATTYPIDVIKSRLQADGMSGQRQYSGFMDCLSKSVKADGYRCLMRGFNAVMARAIICNSVCFSAVNWVFRTAEGRSIPREATAKPRVHSWVYSSLVCTGAFSEAICESEVKEIHDELMPEYVYEQTKSLTLKFKLKDTI